MRSLGEERRTDDAVADCAAVIEAACRLSARVAVEGFSLGGAVSAVALRNLHQQGKLLCQPQ